MRMTLPSCTFSHSVKASGAKTMMGRSVLKPAHLLTLAKRSVARNDVEPAVREMKQDVKNVQPDACDQHGRDRHQGDDMAGRLQLGSE